MKIATGAISQVTFKDESEIIDKNVSIDPDNGLQKLSSVIYSG